MAKRYSNLFGFTIMFCILGETIWKTKFRAGALKLIFCSKMLDWIHLSATRLGSDTFIQKKWVSLCQWEWSWNELCFFYDRHVIAKLKGIPIINFNFIYVRKLKKWTILILPCETWSLINEWHYKYGNLRVHWPVRCQI